MIYHHSPPGSWASIGGDGEAVYEHLDYPAVIHGRTYRNVYYAEQKSKVKQGRVSGGQPVMISGWDEIGFADNCTCVARPYARFPGRDSAGHTLSTQAGSCPATGARAQRSARSCQGLIGLGKRDRPPPLSCFQNECEVPSQIVTPERAAELVPGLRVEEIIGARGVHKLRHVRM